MLDVLNWQEAVECVQEMNCPDMLSVFVNHAINHALELTSNLRKMVGKLFQLLIDEGVLTAEGFQAGYVLVLQWVCEYCLYVLHEHVRLRLNIMFRTEHDMEVKLTSIDFSCRVSLWTEMQGAESGLFRWRYEIHA